MTRMVEPIWKRQSFPKVKKRARVPAVSKKQRAKQAALAQFELGGPCEAGIPNVCTGTAEHRHHRRRRSQGGGEDRANIALLCHACHNHAHANPGWSYRNGLMERTSN